jgi:pyruvate,water dikinase
MVEERRFPSPFEVETVPGTEGWERMYPYYWVFCEERKEWEEKQFWFFNSLHYPDPEFPFDLIAASACWLSLAGTTTRVFAVPPANGVAKRVLNGYLYFSPQAAPPEKIEEKVPLFQKRSAYYYERWDQLYEKWEPKVMALIEELKGIEFSDLPEYEDESAILEHRGYSSGYLLKEKYSKIIDNFFKCWQYHFEFLNLVYVAYLMFFGFCAKAFPGISENTITKMVAGLPTALMFRPEEEIGKLSKLALYLGVGDVFKKGLPVEETISELKKTDQGKRWLEAMELARDPWFYVSSGTGFFHTHPSWNDDLSVPFGHVRTYVERIERGESIERPIEAILAERERLRKEYRELLSTDEDKKVFDQSYETLAMVFPYAENHIFYIEHWHHSLFWRKIRDLGRVLVNAGFFKDPDDIFYFYHTDIPSMLEDLVMTWATGPGTPVRGAGYWAREVEWRKGILAKFREWTPPPALGPAPEVVTEPFTIQLWGITTDTVDSWLAPRPKPEEVTELKGAPASAGVGEGPARVILEVEKLGELQPGEILVCRCTSPSWTPIFGKIKAAVTDIGGLSSHAAIVSREYGLPCVAGTGYATTTIKTGDKLRVDGTTGVVTIMR